MSGLGAAFAGLVNGYVAGKDVRNKWDDRKDEKARTKRADEIRDAAENRAQESHKMSLESSDLLNIGRKQALRVGEQQWQDFDSSRSAANEAVRAAEAGMIAGPAMGAMPAGPAPVPENTTTGPALSFGQATAGKSLFSGPSAGLSFGGLTPAVAPSAAPAAAPSRAIDAFSNGAGLPFSMGMPAPVPGAPAPVQALPAAQQALSFGAVPSQIAQTPNAGLSFGANAPQSASGAELPFSMGVSKDAPKPAQINAPAFPAMGAGPAPSYPAHAVLEYGNPITPGTSPLFYRDQDGKLVEMRKPEGAQEQALAAEILKGATTKAAPQRVDNRTGLQRDIEGLQEAAGPVVKNWGEQLGNTPAALLDVFNAPFRNISTYVTGKDHIGAAPRVGDVDGDGMEQNAFSPAVDLARPAPETPENAKKAYDEATAPPPKNGKPAAEGEKAVAAGATAAMDQVGSSPDMQAAAQNVPAQSFGARPGRQLTPKQTERGAKDFMTSWRENGAPIIMKELMRQGKIEEAQQLDTWVKSAEAQKGMELWAKGQFQAQMGDIMGAYDTWVDAFNEAGYYEDGYEIVKDESEVLTDRSGNPVGVALTFRDQGTGKTHTKTMSPEDMGMAFGLMLSPVEAFKASQERQKALQDQLVAAEKDRAKVAQELIVKDYEGTSKAISEAAKSIFEAGMGQITYPEALRQAQEAHSGTAAGVPDAEVPVLTRPRQ